MSVSNTADEGSNPSARAIRELKMVLFLSVELKNNKNVANIIQYIEESFSELVHKVTWPTWQQLQSSSLVVLVASVIFALLIFVMDYIFGINIKMINGEPTSPLWSGVLGVFYDFFGAFK